MQKLVESLGENDIQQLLPLEDLLVDKLEKAKDSIIDKWEKQPNPPLKKLYILPDVNLIIDKF